MIITTPNDLFARIKSDVLSFLETDSSDFEEKPYCWVYEEENELVAETCEAGDTPDEDMYDYANLTCTDYNTDQIIPDEEEIWAVVDKWLPRKHPEVANFDFPDTLTEDTIIDICNRFRDAIADGDMRGAPQINIRYATANTQWYVAPLGDYFFLDEQLYVFDKLEQWEKYHDEQAVLTFFGHSCPHRGYAHRVAYCGIQTPFRDNLNAPVFTGDICYVRDLPRVDESGSHEGSYHVMTSNEFEGYGFALDNHMLLASDCRHPLQRVGTIFYQLSFDTLKRTWNFVDDINTMYGPSDYLKAHLKMGKLTPCFDQNYEAYFIVSCLTGEFDWRLIVNRESSYALQPKKKDLTLLGITLDSLNDGPDDEPSRVTPNHIRDLQENEIFVFGSNIHGMHGGGAARFAHEQFGAEWGVGEGLTGRCYALPTMEGVDSFEQAVEHFLTCARQHPELTFLVTPVGCGIAGYRPEQVAPWFAPAIDIYNIHLPATFWKILQKG